MSASSVEAKRVPPLSSNAIIVRLLDIVQGDVNRNTGDDIRHIVRPNLLWKSESVEKRETMQLSLLATCHQGTCRGSSFCGAYVYVYVCLLNWLETDALWDTGAQMSIISHSCLKQCLPGCDIRDIAELLDVDGLELKATNEADLPYEGWVELTFNLIEDDSDHTVTVLFLIAKDFLDVPIVGFNVIKEITKHFDRGSSARVNGLSAGTCLLQV